MYRRALVHASRAMRAARVAAVPMRRRTAAMAMAGPAARATPRHFAAAAALAGGLAVGAWALDEQRRGGLAVFAAERAATPQPTVLTGNHDHGAFVVLHVKDVAKAAAVAKTVPQLVAGVLEDNYIEDTANDAGLRPLMVGVAFGTAAWAALCKARGWNLPPGFSHNVKRKGKSGTIPATGGDVFLHVKGATRSLCYEAVAKFREACEEAGVKTKQVNEHYSFKFQDGRDLTGFLDGTENAPDPAAAALTEGGGSYIIHQKWKHKLAKFHALPVEDQEFAIGRTKPDSAELEGEEQWKTSHVSRMRDSAFRKIPIYRQSMPFGSVSGEHGLLFIAYANTTEKFNVMMDQMAGRVGEPDELMKYSECEYSNYYYIPTQEELKSL